MKQNPSLKKFVLIQCHIKTPHSSRLFKCKFWFQKRDKNCHAHIFPPTSKPGVQVPSTKHTFMISSMHLVLCGAKSVSEGMGARSALLHSGSEGK